EPIFLSLFVICVGVSYPWVQNHFFVWSEPLFSTLLFFLAWMMLAKRNWAWVAVLCVLLYFVRKAGVMISAGVVCAYVVRNEYKKAFLVAIITSSAALCWEWLTSLYSSGSTVLTIFDDSPAENKWNYLGVVTAWFVPRYVPLSVRVFLLGSFIALV